MKKILLVLMLGLLIYNPLKSQDNNLRVEIELDGNNDNFYVLPVGTKGVLLFNEIDDDKTSKRMQKYSFTLLDNNFEKVWSKKVEISDAVFYYKQYFDPVNNELFVLFNSPNNQKEEWKQYDYGNYTVVKISIDTKEITVLNESNKIPTKLTGFTVYNQKVYLGGYVVPSSGGKMMKQIACYCGCGIPYFLGILNYKPVPILMTFDFNNSTTKTHQYETLIPGQMNDIFASAEENIVYGLFNTKPDKNTAKMLIKDIDGGSKDKTSKSISFKMTDEEDICSPKLYTNENHGKILIGGYSDAQSTYKITQIGVANVLKGLVFANIVDGSIETMKYIKFQQLNNIILYYNKSSARSESNAKKQAKKKLSEGKDLRLRYNLLIHDIISVKKDEYIMVAESYYPQYHVEYYTSFDSKGNMHTTSRTVFDGYRYTHGMVVAFDKDGTVLWDQAFEIDDILTFNLKQRIKVTVDNEKIICGFTLDDAVKSITFENGEKTNERVLSKFKTNFKNDKVKDEMESDVDFWYDNYLISYGYQKIKNTSKKGKKNRTVFYFNKIEYTN